jgi:hypothetical protein
MDAVNAVNDVEKPPDQAQLDAEFQKSVDALSQQLIRKYQLNGDQFNALEVEVRLFIATEQLNVLTKIIQQITNGYSDAQLTAQMTEQVNKLAKTFETAFAAAPRIASAAGVRLNGSGKH